MNVTNINLNRSSDGATGLSSTCFCLQRSPLFAYFFTCSDFVVFVIDNNKRGIESRKQKYILYWSQYILYDTEYVIPKFTHPINLDESRSVLPQKKRTVNVRWTLPKYYTKLNKFPEWNIVALSKWNTVLNTFHIFFPLSPPDKNLQIDYNNKIFLNTILNLHFIIFAQKQ